jgi:hypothetical protein
MFSCFGVTIQSIKISSNLSDMTLLHRVLCQVHRLARAQSFTPVEEMSAHKRTQSTHYKKKSSIGIMKGDTIYFALDCEKATELSWSYSKV